MKYSILQPIKNKRYCWITKRPEELKHPHRPAQGVAMGKAYSKPLTFKMSSINPDGKDVPDAIHTGTNYLIVSERFKLLLEKLASVDVEYLPFKLVDHDGKAAVTVYVVNVLGTIDCGDAAGSEGNLFPGKNVFLDCKRLAIHEERVPAGVNLFRVDLFPQLVFVDADLRKAIEEAKLIVGFFAPGERL